ncbi:MAG: Bax inhibitor-1/YccA family protein [bacterium]|nr:Bax inhibitor-1/YccA family protein [bacterium]
MSNPVMNIIENDAERTQIVDENNVMTVKGTLQVTGLMGLLLFASASMVWIKLMTGHTDFGMMLMGIGFFASLISYFIILFSKKGTFVPVYAIGEGFVLGGLSAIMETSYPGVVSNAVLGTFVALFSMLVLYQTNVIRCTDKFRSVIFISTLSIAIMYLINFIGHFFGYSIPFITSSSNVGLIFSGIVVLIASLNLIIDFSFIEEGAMRCLPKEYEWFGAFGLMVTLVWLYIEILNLLVKLQNRR